MRPFLASVLFVLVRCSNGVLPAWLRDVASFVGELEAVAPSSDSVSALCRSAENRLVAICSFQGVVLDTDTSANILS